MNRSSFADEKYSFKKFRQNYVTVGEVWIARNPDLAHDAIYINSAPYAESCTTEEQNYDVFFLQSSKVIEQNAAAQVSNNRFGGIATDSEGSVMEMSQFREAGNMRLNYDFKAGTRFTINKDDILTRYRNAGPYERARVLGF